MNALILTILALLALYPVGWYWFKFGAWLKRKGSWLVVPVGLIFMPMDFVFQYTWGSWFFGEWPPAGEHTFSARIRRYRRMIVAKPYLVNDELRALTNYWKAKLNAEIPGHIDT